MIAADALAAFRRALGSGVVEDADLIRPRLTDWRGTKTGSAGVMLRPGSTAEMVELVRIAAAHRVGLVPQGGNTGMVGGSVPEPEGGVALVALDRLVRIRSIDPLDGSLVAEAGVTLSAVHDAAATVDRAFPLTLGARGSATIGGLVSTNAGGSQVLRHGPMRALVLGLEAVLPDGTLLDQLSTLRKDNTGYDVKQLLIGAEGTLGLVTAAALKLVPAARSEATAVVALHGLDAALPLLARLREASGDRVESFELMPREALDLVAAQLPHLRQPFAAPPPAAVLVALASSASGDPLADMLESELARAVRADQVLDAAVARSQAQADAFWAIREGIPEAERREGPAVKNDIAVPLTAMPRFIREVSVEVEARWPGSRPLAFGHLGDGNVHFNVRAPLGDAGWTAREGEAVRRFVHDRVRAYGGSISAEHGIGTLKRDELARLADPGKYAAMLAIKRALDPHGIMNPGKLFRLA